MSKWIEVRDEAVLAKALKLARGCYQRNLLLGRESYSGSTLTGRAREWSGRYKNSRLNLMARIWKADLPVEIEERDHGRLVIVFG